MRQATLDGAVGNPVEAQDPAFRGTQLGLRERFPAEWDAFEQAFLAMASERPEGVTSREVAEALEATIRDERVRRSLRGCVPGNLVARKLIVTKSRENAEQAEAKGRKVGRYVATPRALELRSVGRAE
jgi:hypothetical protein